MGSQHKDAALCVSVLGGSSLLGRSIVGRLLDRFFGPHVALAINLLTALGMFFLARVSSFPAGCWATSLIHHTVGVCMGQGAGGEAAMTPYLLTRYFGLRAFSTLYGLTWTFYAASNRASHSRACIRCDWILCLLVVLTGRNSRASGSHESPAT